MALFELIETNYLIKKLNYILFITEHCEADTFWCFTSLMSEIRDMYNSQLDSDQSTGKKI
jgi:hypothetical protein